MSLENINSWQAACRLIPATLLSVGGYDVPVPPQSVSGGVTTFNYPAAGVTSVTLTGSLVAGSGLFFVELDVAAADEDLICTASAHGTAALTLAVGAAPTIGYPPPGPGPGGTYLSLNRGFLDPSYFRTVDFTTLAANNAPERAIPTECDLIFERLPQAQIQSQI